MDFIICYYDHILIFGIMGCKWWLWEYRFKISSMLWYYNWNMTYCLKCNLKQLLSSLSYYLKFYIKNQ